MVHLAAMSIAMLVFVAVVAGIAFLASYGFRKLVEKVVPHPPGGGWKTAPGGGGTQWHPACAGWRFDR